jgi:hypothetical protein
LKRSGFKKKKSEIILNTGSGRNMGREMGLGKNRKVVKSKMECHGAKRGKKKGSAAGGIITGVKLGIKRGTREKGEEEGCME